MTLTINVNYLSPRFSFGSWSSVEEEDDIVDRKKKNSHQNTAGKKNREKSVIPSSSTTSTTACTSSRIHNVDQILRLSNEDVNIDFRKPLGEGGFCTVYPVKVKGIANDKELALKRLRLGIIRQQENNPNVIKEALQDLNHEVNILKTLSDHENVIQLHGYSSSHQNKSDIDFFIVLDKLKDTLDCRFDKWEQNRGYFTQALPKEIIQTRLQDVVMGIAKGMEYIHSKRIMFRDLKPANIGFDSTNCVKILDFGLATPCNTDIMGPTPFRGKIGTLRYMAPEVSNNLRYGLSADVYSFAILLWQVCTSRLPYEEDLGMFDKTLPKNKRPSLKYIESKELQTLLKISWDNDPMNRPTFHDLSFHLKKMIPTIPKDGGGGGFEEEEGKEEEEEKSSLTTTTRTAIALCSKVATQKTQQQQQQQQQQPKKQQQQKMIQSTRKTSYFLSLQQQQFRWRLS